MPKWFWAMRRRQRAERRREAKRNNPGKGGGVMYDQFPTVAAAKKAYRRCRTQKHFILADEAAAPKICAVCGQPVDNHQKFPNQRYAGNRCIYDPKTKRVAVLEYYCSWQSLMAAIFNRTGEAAPVKLY